MLGFIVGLPILVGIGLRYPLEPALQPFHPPLFRGMEFHGAEVTLSGEDSSCVRLAASLLRLEAANTRKMVSASKAVVAHDAIVRPVGEAFPEWRFGRIQILSARGPYEWFEPARCTHIDGKVQILDDHRGSFTITDGRINVLPHSK
ncbi:hypothetical protein CMO84_07625 [Candidatus Woesearchaeota archaeon]|nr:hypothetical protein [Candidatus Woesearchaeota archaeon]